MKKLIFIYAAISLLAGGCFPGCLEAEVHPEIQYQYFDVPYIQGKTVPEMIRLSSPLVGDNGYKYAGMAKWKIHYKQATVTQPTIDVCRIDNPGVGVSCNISLPQLIGGDEKAKLEFTQRVEETKVHEIEHCRIAARHASELEIIFKKMDKYPCHEIGKKMHEKLLRVHDDCIREQARFDYDEYGHANYLYLQSLQGASKVGLNVVPPKEGHNMPRLQWKKRTELKNIPQEADEFKEKGIYKDKNGVWRNY